MKRMCNHLKRRTQKNIYNNNMPNYQNGKIYSIRSHQTDEIYIGSTTQPLSMRMATHRRDYKCYLQGKMHYITSFKILEFGDAYIELIEEFPCVSKMHLEKREGEIIRKMEKCANRCIAGRTMKEYRQDHKEHLKEWMKKYREDNKDKIKEYKAQQITCDCGSTFRRNDKARHEKSKKHKEYIAN
jgi:hypothetical protein